jgi:hypothetical protein
MEYEKNNVIASIFTIVFIIYVLFGRFIISGTKRLFKRLLNFLYIKDDKLIGNENVMLIRIKNWFDTQTLSLEKYIKGTKKKKNTKK